MSDTAHPFSVSVVVPLYNKERAIERTLTSVIAQTCAAAEVILVDDGSTDASLLVAESVIASAPTKNNFRIISQENSGVSAARNRGAAEAKSEFIAFLDADDEWAPTCIAEFRRLATAFPDATVLTVRLSRLRLDGSVVPEPSALPHGFFGKLERPLREYSRGYGIMSASSIAVKRDAWERSGGFPVAARNGEDIYWFVKLCAGERFAHSGLPLTIRHDEHSGVAERRGSVPHHLSYFLGTDEGQKCLSDRELVHFLRRNLPIQIIGQRLAGDSAVVSELVRLSAALPYGGRFRTWVSLAIPVRLLRYIRDWRRRMRPAQSPVHHYSNE